MNAEQTKDVVLGAASALGAVLANAMGGWDAALKVLVVMMAADYLTGMAVALVWHRSNKTESGAADSRAGFKGLVRKCAILMLVYIGVLLDEAAGTHYVRSAVSLFFIGNEGLSLLENVGLMGVEYPPFLKEMLQALHERGDSPQSFRGEDGPPSVASRQLPRRGSQDGGDVHGDGEKDS